MAFANTDYISCVIIYLNYFQSHREKAFLLKNKFRECKKDFSLVHK